MASAAAPTDDGVVTVAWLKDRLGQPGIKVLDGSWYMPAQARNGLQEFKAKRIPGARYFDIDTISDPSTGLPHMLPSAAAFSAVADALGVNASDTIVVYDGLGIFSAARVWWTFKAFGHKSVYVLEGGLPAWVAEGGDLDTSPVGDAEVAAAADAARTAKAPGSYPATLDASKVRDWQQVLNNLKAEAGDQEQVVDARSLGRFLGTEPEPRAGLAAGHIPGSRNVPFPTVLEGGARLKPGLQLRDVFAQAGVDLDGPVVASCGSGLTACILALAAYRATGGEHLLALYDGSWSEWGALPGVPVSTDAPA